MCRLSNREVSCRCIQSAAAAAAAAADALCVAMLLWILLLPAAVRHRVPDDQICCWCVESDLSLFFLLIQT